MALFNINVSFDGDGFVELEFAGETLTAGDLCYLGTDSKYYKANAGAKSTSTTELRIALVNIPINTSGTFLIKGKYNVAGLTSGSKYYIDLVNGGFSTTQPGATNVVRYIGTAYSTTVLEFNPDETYVLADGTEVNDITFAGGGGSAHVIQEEGTPLAARTNLNFIGAGVTATDNAGASATDITIVAGSIGGSITDNQIAVGATTANNIEGTANFIYDGTDVTLAGGKLNIGLGGTTSLDFTSNNGYVYGVTRLYGANAVSQTVSLQAAYTGFYQDLRPGVNDGANNGQDLFRWSNTYSILGNYSGLLTSIASPTLGTHVGNRDYNDIRYTTTLTAGTGLTGGGSGGTLTVNAVGGTGLTAVADAINLDNTAVTPGTYTAANITVDQQGRITAAANGTGGGGGTVTEVTTGTGLDVVTGTTTPNITMDLAEFGAIGTGVLNGATDYLMVLDNTVEQKILLQDFELGLANNSAGWTTNIGTVTDVTTGIGLDSSGGTTPNITLDLNELPASALLIGTDDIVVVNGTASQKEQIDQIPLSIFNNDAGWNTGNVSNIGTPANDQVAIWTGSDTIEGNSNLRFNGTNLTLDGGGISANGNIGCRNGEVQLQAGNGIPQGEVFYDATLNGIKLQADNILQLRGAGDIRLWGASDIGAEIEGSTGLIYGNANTTSAIFSKSSVSKVLITKEYAEIYYSGSGTVLPVIDTTAIVKGSVDSTKLVRIEADGLTTGTTRVITMADYDIDMANVPLLDANNVFTGFNESSSFVVGSSILTNPSLKFEFNGTNGTQNENRISFDSNNITFKYKAQEYLKYIDGFALTSPLNTLTRLDAESTTSKVLVTKEWVLDQGYGVGGGGDAYLANTQTFSGTNTFTAAPKIKLNAPTLELENAAGTQTGSIYMDTSGNTTIKSDNSNVVLSNSVGTGFVVFGSTNVSYNTIHPQSDSIVDLGTTSLRWRELFADDITMNGTLRIEDSAGTKYGTLSASSTVLSIDSISTVDINIGGGAIVIDGADNTVEMIKLIMASLPIYANDAAASALTAGQFYQTITGELRIKL